VGRHEGVKGIGLKWATPEPYKCKHGSVIYMCWKVCVDKIAHILLGIMKLEEYIK
jgi:hypothetical protein